MTGRMFGSIALLGVVLILSRTAAFAQTSCAPEVPGMRDPQSVARFMTGVPNDGGLRVGRVSYLNYNALSPRLKSITLAGFQRMSMEVRAGDIAGPGQARLVEFVTASYFDVLGVGMQAGRAFATSHDEPGRQALEAVISHALSESMPDRQTPVVGRTITVNGRPVTIVGVAAEDFHGMAGRDVPTALWLPGVTLPILNEVPGLRSDDRASGGYYEFIVRRATGATSADAVQELGSATKWLLQQYPVENAKFTDVGFHSVDALFCAGR